MPFNIPGLTVTATKQASGTVQFQFFSTLDGLNSDGGLRFAVVLPAADVTNINTNVNGGAAGATRTFTYAQDANKNDYPPITFDT